MRSDGPPFVTQQAVPGGFVCGVVWERGFTFCVGKTHIAGPREPPLVELGLQAALEFLVILGGKVQGG
jgi:hypothetical protein